MLITTPSGWPYNAFTPWHLYKSTAHEYIHARQSSISGATLTRDPWPNWLTEGMAEYLAYEIVIDAEIMTRAQVRTFNLAQRLQDAPALQNCETHRGMGQQCNYGLLTLSVSYLVQATGPNALLAYTKASGTGIAWTTAFQNSFGISASDYYSRFAVYRANNFN